MSRHFVIVFFNEGNSDDWCDANGITAIIPQQQQLILHLLLTQSLPILVRQPG